MTRFPASTSRHQRASALRCLLFSCTVSIPRSQTCIYNTVCSKFDYGWKSVCSSSQNNTDARRTPSLQAEDPQKLLGSPTGFQQVEDPTPACLLGNTAQLCARAVFSVPPASGLPSWFTMCCVALTTVRATVSFYSCLYLLYVKQAVKCFQKFYRACK